MADEVPGIAAHATSEISEAVEWMANTHTNDRVSFDGIKAMASTYNGDDGGEDRNVESGTRARMGGSTTLDDETG